MKKLVLTLIRFYKKYLSLGNFGVKSCRFEPSCSVYTYQAIEKYGILRGSLMGLWRILRCNPFSKGGYDPVK
ncbi:MAG: membrane protein insertion efficiency factor YidD [Patescibacteria group bacterium]